MIVSDCKTLKNSLPMKKTKHFSERNVIKKIGVVHDMVSVGIGVGIGDVSVRNWLNGNAEPNWL